MIALWKLDEYPLGNQSLMDIINLRGHQELSTLEDVYRSTSCVHVLMFLHIFRSVYFFFLVKTVVILDLGCNHAIIFYMSFIKG